MFVARASTPGVITLTPTSAGRFSRSIRSRLPGCSTSISAISTLWPARASQAARYSRFTGAWAVPIDLKKGIDLSAGRTSSIKSRFYIATLVILFQAFRRLSPGET